MTVRKRENLLPNSYPCSAGTCETNDAGGIVESDIGREKLYVLTPVPSSPTKAEDQLGTFTSGHAPFRAAILVPTSNGLRESNRPGRATGPGECLILILLFP